MLIGVDSLGAQSRVGYKLSMLQPITFLNLGINTYFRGYTITYKGAKLAYKGRVVRNLNDRGIT